MAAKTSGGDPKEADLKGKGRRATLICKHAFPVFLSHYLKVNPVHVPLSRQLNMRMCFSRKVILFLCLAMSFKRLSGWSAELMMMLWEFICGTVDDMLFFGGGIAIAPKVVNVIHAMVDQKKKDMSMSVLIDSHRQHVNCIRGKRPRSEGSSSESLISFSDADLEGVYLPHNDFLVISLNVDDHQVDKILVDPGSAVNVMYKKLFEKLRLKQEDLQPTSAQLCGFAGRVVVPKGQVSLRICVGQETVWTEFLVVDVYSSYNAIVGTSWLHDMKAVPSTYYQVVKFPPSMGIEAIRGDQKVSKECFMIEVKGKEKAMKIVAASGIADGCMRSDSGPIAVFDSAEPAEEELICGTVDDMLFLGGGIAIAPKVVNVIHAMVDQKKKDMSMSVLNALHRQHVNYIRGKRPISEGSSSESLISFSDADLEGVDLPHNDFLVISLNMGGHQVDKILVDPGSSVNVMYKKLFEELRLKQEDLQPTSTRMCGFDGSVVAPKGQVLLRICVEQETVWTEFLVVDVYSSYNAIVGTSWLHDMKAVPSTYYQLVKFPSSMGIKAIRGDQKVSKECLMIEVKGKEKAVKEGRKMATKRSVRTLKEADLKGKKVFVRVDLNVPLDDNLNITDDTRVRAAVPTIKYLMGHGAKVILASHLGCPKGVTPKYSLKPLVPRLSELLGIEVKMANDCIGEEVQIMVAEIPEGGVLLLENVRFYKEEEKNDPEFAKKLASLADLYVNDAFGTAHRAHASTEGVAKYLKPSVAGFLMQKELDYLVGAVSNPKKPFAAIVGGSKVSSKIGVIESLLEKVDMLLLGGGMIFTFYKAQGYSVGLSLVEEDMLDLATSLLEKAKSKGVALMLPTDVVAADKFAADANSKIVPASGIPDGWMGLDIGPDSIKTFGEALDSTKTVIWNGPMGVFEFDKFAVGTEIIAKKLADLSSGKGVTTIIGGGDSVAAVEKVGLADKMSHISTGGGASLELLEWKSLPGVLALDDV